MRDKDDINQWFKFFLVGVIETAKSSVNAFDNILKLQKEVDAQVQKLGSRSKNAQVIINYLFQRPIIDAAKVKELTNLSSPSVYKLIYELENLEIIEEMTGGKRGKIFMFKKYTNLFS